MVIEAKRSDELLRGGLLAAFTTAVAACAGTAAHATTFVTTTLATPVTFDLLSQTPSSLDLHIGGGLFTVSQNYTGVSGPFNYSISLDGGSNSAVINVISNPAGLKTSSFSSPNDIGQYSDYASGSLKTETGSNVVAATGGAPGDGVGTNLPNGSGYLGIFVGPYDRPGYISFDNVISTDPTTNVQDDLFTVTGYGVAVPEPETWALLVLGAGAVGASLRRRRRQLEAAA